MIYFNFFKGAIGINLHRRLYFKVRDLYVDRKKSIEISDRELIKFRSILSDDIEFYKNN